MSSKHTAEVDKRLPVLPDTGKARMARIPDIDWNASIGRAIQRAISDVWSSHKEAAAEIGVDDAEFGKWLSGARRPQLDKLWAITRLRQPLCVRFAELAGACIETRVSWPLEKVG